MALTKKVPFEGDLKKLSYHAMGFNFRERVPIATINNGLIYELLPKLRGYKYRIQDITLIAIGGVTAGGTSVNITGTQGGSVVNLLVAALAALTQSAVVRIGAANAVVLANGASFSDCDVETAINLTTVGTFTGNTHFDVLINYTLEKA